MADLIYITPELAEIGPCKENIDFDVGEDNATNDFLLKGIIPDGVGGIYVPGTEFGGLIGYMQTSNKSDIVSNKGYTWRGLLTLGIISPSAGSSYKVVSGDANAILAELLGDYMGGIFTIPEETSGITITDYQFPLYCTLLAGISGMLEEYNAKLRIVADKPATGGTITVTIDTVPAVTIENLYTRESPVSLTFTDNRLGINHLICLGQGELEERTRVDLYVQEDGSIGTAQYYTGFDERTAIYDYPNAESEANLIRYGKLRLKSIMTGKSLTIDNSAVDGDVGDFVSAYYNGASASVRITQKILTITGDKWKYESKIKGVT